MEQQVVNEKLDELRNAFNSNGSENGNQESNDSEEGVGEVNSRKDLIERIQETIINRNLYQMSEFEHINAEANKDALFSIDEIVDSFQQNQFTDEQSQQINLLDLIHDYYASIKFNVFDFLKHYNQTKYLDFVKEYFKDGIDLVKADKLEVKVNELLTAGVSIETEESSFFIKDNKVYTEFGEEDLSKYKFCTAADPISFDQRRLEDNQSWFLYKLKTANPVQVESVDFEYQTAKNILIFRVYNEFIQIIYNGNVVKTIQFIELLAANAEIPIKYVLAGETRRYMEAALAASTLNARNAEYSPADDIFDTLKLAGMTKYEQIGYLCKYLPTLEQVEDMYPKVNYQLLNKFKNGVPDEICQTFNLDRDNRVDNLRDLMESIKEMIAESEDPKLISYYSTCELFFAIIDEDLAIGAFNDPQLMLKAFSFKFIADALYKVMKHNNLKTYDDILDYVNKNHFVVFEKKDKFKYLANSCEYYMILDYYARYARKFLFVKSIIREPSFLPAQEQYDFGFVADIVPLQSDGARQSKSLANYKNYDASVLFKYMGDAYVKAIQQNTAIAPDVRNVLLRSPYLPCYYFVSSMYYQISEAVPPRSPELPIGLGAIVNGNVNVNFNLGKIDFPICNETLQLNVPANLVQDALNHIQTHTLKADNYLSITDYLKLQYKYQKSMMIPEFIVVNMNIDYHKIITKEKFMKINSYTMMQKEITPTLKSGEFFLFGREAAILTRNFMDAGLKPLDQLQPDQMEAVDLVNDCLAGIPIPGFTENIIPAQFYYNLFGRQMLTDKRAYNHTPKYFDYNNSDMHIALQYPEVVQEDACTYEEKKNRQEIAFATFELPSKSALIRENIDRNIIDFTKMSIDSIIAYIQNKPSVLRLNSDTVMFKGEVKSMYSPEVLSEAALKIDDNRYIIKAGTEILLLTLKEETYV